VAGWARSVGVVGFLLSVGAACTQLFGDPQKNTLAPRAPVVAPFGGTSPLQPAVPAEGLCTAGQMRCEGPLLQTCSDDRASWVTAQRCGAAALCQAEPAACLPATCSEDEMTCAGSVLQKCNASRTGWDLFATCLSPAHCNADLRQCLPEACNPGARRCDRSDVDQSPVLEICRDDRSDWSRLDACVTRELCEQTLTETLTGGLVVDSDGMVQLQAPVTPATVVSCLLPACAVGEVRCEGSQLQFCDEGRTGWTVAEDCASPALCAGSLTNVNSSGTPQCVPPACAANEHQCTAGGVLQVCSEDRTGFRVIQSCIGPAFCNAVLADQGGEGCQAAPCDPAEMQCNGVQIQVCRADQTGLDPLGAPCESAALCNADDPLNAFCAEATCRRGPTSGNEFHCEGPALQRCNESLTGYDTLQTCVTPGLCDASQRFEGCRPPRCQPGQHACNPEGFLQTCNADQTGFDDTENCGSPGQCDANAGRCSDPCEPGTVRCNAQSGDLEECRDLLSGWQTIADCLSLPLCDAANRRCNPPVCAAGARRCETRGQNPVVAECAPGREAFNVLRTCAAGQICDAQNNECDVCTPNAVRCDGDTLVTCDSRGQTETRRTCAAGLCSAQQRRCLACGPPGSARCTNQQLLVCTQSPQGEFEASEFCETDELCGQTLNGCGRGLNGQACQCNDGVCRPNQVRCNNGRVERCNEGLTGFNSAAQCAAPELCNAATADCNTCVGNQFSCLNGQMRQCAADGRSFARNVNLECASNTQLRVCNGNTATVQNCPNGCTNGRGCNQCTGNGVQCVNGNQIQRCVNGFFQLENCANGCNAGATSCNACQGNGSTCSNGNTEQRCVNGQFQQTQCPQGCVGGQCASCTAAQCVNGNQRRACNNGQLAAPTNCAAGQTCSGQGVCSFNCQQLNCNDNNPCTNDTCSAQGGCAHNAVADGTNCADADRCDGTETCRAGVCSATGTRVTCADTNPCTVDSNNNCNPATGTCTFPNAANGTPCGGNNMCQGGQCMAPTPPAPTCTPGALDCRGAGATLRRCNAAGTGFEAAASCEGTVFINCTSGTPTRQQCTAPSGGCTVPLCQPRINGIAGGGCATPAAPVGRTCLIPPTIAQGVCGNGDGICHQCNVTADCRDNNLICLENQCVSNIR